VDTDWTTSFGKAHVGFCADQYIKRQWKAQNDAGARKE
jgi:hypothetical protein